MLRMFKETKIDFIGIRKIFYVFSGVMILFSCVMFVTRGVKFGVDFTGGSMVQVRFFGPKAHGPDRAGPGRARQARRGQRLDSEIRRVE